MGKKSRLKKEKLENQLESKIEKEVQTEPFLLNVIRIGTYLIFLTPLILSGKAYFPFVGPKSLYFMGICEIIFFTWLYLAFKRKEYRPKLNFILASFGLFLIALILSSVFGIDFSRSFWSKYERMTGLLMWLHLFAFFLATSSTFKKSDWKKIFIASVFLSLLVSCFSILEHLKIKQFTFSDRGGFTLGNTSFLGSYILFNVFLAFYLLVKENKILILKILYSFAVVLGILTMYFQGARAALGSTIAGFGLIALLWLCFESKKKIIRGLNKIVLVVSIIAVLYAIVLLYLPDNFVHDKFGELATKGRFANWEIAQKATLERPLLGWGPENYTVIFTRFFNPSLFLPEYGSEIWFDRTHNIILDTLVITGIIGLITYLGIFVNIFSVLKRKYFNEKTIDFWTFSTFIALPAAYFVQNLTVFDMATSLMMFALILGFVAFLAGSKRDDQKIKIVPERKTLAIVLSFIFIFTFFNFIIQPNQTDIYTVKALADSEGRRLMPEQRVEFYKKALESSQMGKYQIREFFGQTSENIIRANTSNLSLQQVKLELDFVISELEKTNKESPLEYRSVLKLAKLYSLYALAEPEKLELANFYGEECLRLSPANQQGYWTLAQTKIYQGDLATALSLAQQAIDLEPRWFQSHDIAIQISKMSEQTEITEQLIQNAITINPEWASQFIESANIEE